jgi:rod shape-determining protein MreD
VNRGALYYMMLPLLAAACLFQTTAAARIKIYGVKPDLVLLLVVIGTLVYGGRSGLIWAFFGGLGLDIFSGGPMGSSSLALMAAVLVAGFGHRTLSRYNVFVPMVAMVVGTLVYSGAYLSILAVLQYLDVTQHQVPLLLTLQNVVVPAIVYNTTLMVILIPFLNRIPESQDL